MEILILLLLMVLNGLFAMSEMAVIFARKVRLQQWAREGKRGARAALELAENPHRLLSTIQVGMTLIGILAGAFGGTTVAQSLEGSLNRMPMFSSYSRMLSVGIVVLGLTYLSVVIGELVPKRMALGNAERIAALVARPLAGLARAAHPLVQFLTGSSEWVLRIFGYRPSAGPSVTEEEIKILIEQGARDGILTDAEKDIVKGVFRLADREVGVLMTPRMEMVCLDAGDPLELTFQKIREHPFSRYPVIQGGLENVLGVVRVKDVLAQMVGGRPWNLQEILLPPLYIPENASALYLLDRFKKSRPHLALVVDEYGDIQGLVTLNDILEAIVGDLGLPELATEAAAIQREDGSWLVDGMMPVDEFKELLQLSALPDEDSHHYQTLGGLVMMQMGRIPKAADVFYWQGLRFEVVDMDGKRVDKVLVSQEKAGGR